MVTVAIKSTLSSVSSRQVTELQGTGGSRIVPPYVPDRLDLPWRAAPVYVLQVLGFFPMRGFCRAGFLIFIFCRGKHRPMKPFSTRSILSSEVRTMMLCDLVLIECDMF